MHAPIIALVLLMLCVVPAPFDDLPSVVRQTDEASWRIRRMHNVDDDGDGVIDITAYCWIDRGWYGNLTQTELNSNIVVRFVLINHRTGTTTLLDISGQTTGPMHDQPHLLVTTRVQEEPTAPWQPRLPSTVLAELARRYTPLGTTVPANKQHGLSDLLLFLFPNPPTENREFFLPLGSDSDNASIVARIGPDVHGEKPETDHKRLYNPFIDGDHERRWEIVVEETSPTQKPVLGFVLEEQPQWATLKLYGASISYDGIADWNKAPHQILSRTDQTIRTLEGALAGPSLYHVLRIVVDNWINRDKL